MLPNKQLSEIRKKIYSHIALISMVLVVTGVLALAITTAWYTNVNQTSGLEFELAEWGFEGNVYIQEETILISPGEQGIVDLTIENLNDNIVASTVNFSKEEMSEQMQKRLYFYADTTEITNDEVVDKLYLNNNNIYTYTITSNNTLEISDENSNDVEIKWEWVYDVLGYYVEGSFEENEDSEEVMEIAQYLKPIVYEYDNATFDEDGELLTVDGTTTKEEFLIALAQSDGYKSQEELYYEQTSDDYVDLTSEEYDGMDSLALASNGFSVASSMQLYGIDPENPVDGYYPIDVDEDGYGVWIYINNQDEIIEEIAYDTAYGLMSSQVNDEGIEDIQPITVYYGDYDEQEERSSITIDELPLSKVIVSVTAQQKNIDTTSIITPQVLFDTINSSDEVVVQLATNIETSEKINVVSGQDVLIDLNGYTLTTDYETNGGIYVGENATLTIINGVIDNLSAGSSSSTFVSVGGEILLSEVELQTSGYGILIADYASNDIDSVVKIVDSDITAGQIGVLMQGNGVDSGRYSQLIIENSIIDGTGYIGIMGNGSDSATASYWGTYISISNSQISGYWGAMYLPQRDSETIISNSVLTGYTGIAVKGGEVSIIDTEIYGTGSSPDAPAFAGSGYTDTGAGISIETNYPWDIAVYVSGEESIVSSEATDAIVIYEADADNAFVELTAGKYTSDVSDFVADGYQADEVDGYYEVSESLMSTFALFSNALTQNGVAIVSDENQVAAKESIEEYIEYDDEEREEIIFPDMSAVLGLDVFENNTQEISPDMFEQYQEPVEIIEEVEIYETTTDPEVPVEGEATTDPEVPVEGETTTDPEVPAE
ncbi:MAG: hypothetical protein R3Y09_12825, partial [Clostridia bacterium]